MKTSEFLNTLRAHADRPLTFQRGETAVGSPGYHLTEIKRLAVESMDCGAATHRWQENHFEIWNPPGRENGRADFMAAGKFLRIVDLVQQQVVLDGEAEAKIYAGDRQTGAVVHAIDRLELAGGRLVVRLEAEATRCKARERQLGGAVAAAVGCCSGEDVSGADDAGCGCVPAKREAAACCA